MIRRQRSHFPITFLSLIAFLSLALVPEVRGQNIHPGATPAWSEGDPNAPVSIEVFNDYQCPACARFNQDLKKIKAEYKSRVRIIFRNFPLSPVMHKNALPAAAAAEAAGLQGKLVEMIDLLYEGGEQWHASEDAGQVFTSYARALNLDVARFVRDMKGEEVRERIQSDVKRATSLRVMGTPTVFVNVKDVDVPLGNVQRAIKEVLGATKP